MYYLTIKKNGEVIVSRQPFADYAAAVAFTGQFYQPRSARSVLTFTSEVINGEFARSYATLEKPEDVDKDRPFYKEARHAATKKANAFNFEGSYFFLIESDCGIRDAEAIRAEAEKDE